MRGRKKLSIRFVGKPTANGKDVTISCRVSYNRKKTEWSLYIRGEAADWMEKEDRFSENRDFNLFLNRTINDAKLRLEECYRTLQAKGIEPTPKLLRNQFKGIADTRHQPELLHYVDAYIDNLKQKPEEVFKKSSLTHYTSMRSRLEKFLRSIDQEHILLKDVGPKEMLEFKEFLSVQKHPTLPKTLEKSTIGKILSKLRCISNGALRKGLLNADPFYKVKVDRSSGDTPYLTLDELRRIEEVDLSHNLSLHRVRLIFLFGAFSGLRLGDTRNLRRDQITTEQDGTTLLHFMQQKTVHTIQRPLLDKCVRIMDELKQMEPDSAYVVPRISGQKLNAYLKVVADLASVNKNLSFRVARKTFGMVLLESGISIDLVGHFLGHRSVKTTIEYYSAVTRSMENNVIRRVNDLSATHLKKVS